MAGMDDNVSVIGDWTPLNPSPRTLMPNFLNDGFSPRPFPDNLAGNGNVEPARKPENRDGVDTAFQFSNVISLDSGMFDASKPAPRSGLAERMASRAGFSAPKIDMAGIKSVNIDSSTTEVRSPYLTIPAGLSPTTLLDSPVFLSNMAQPSPTTGKLLFEQYNGVNMASSLGVTDKVKQHTLEDASESFAFKPHLDTSSSFFSTSDNKQALPSIDISVPTERQVRAGNVEAVAISFQNQHDFNLQTGFSDSSDRRNPADNAMFNQKVSDEQSPPLEDQQDEEADPKSEFSSVTAGAPADDGYNWRKYGQKQVKGSEYPRSYYKCTHQNCPVKKKVERSHEGHITEIIYKGAHSHPKPAPNRRSGIVPSQSYTEMPQDGSENPGLQANLDGKHMWNNSQSGHEWRSDGLDATSSASMPVEIGDPAASLQAQHGARFESQDVAIDVSSTLSNDEEDDGATHGSVSLGGDGEGDETESKRRKVDSSVIEMSAASRAVREPRVVVQTTSEVDILDDGYRWRKYGQKVVKGNPNPRSYYKCTNPGCTVRKHVERASHDLKSVITTYEGKHNHDVPAARGSGHSNSGPSPAVGVTTSQSQGLHRRPELIQAQDSLMRFNSPQLAAFGPPGNFGFTMGQQGLNNLSISSLNMVASMKMPVLPPVHPYMACQQPTDPNFMIPKGEPKEEPMSESTLPLPNGSSSVYHQIINRLPLGPQL
ncbi:WRKY transcription factor 2 protein [Dioscorea alata]|uniref:WRKY transcription factor 2 protein n=1 Tax=Dioscorea alata TaxID=55571 RepID=A0ACB7VJ77_DIOAL|nr:WRKY transcription factor 2 protein [Dioscorea alata]